MAAITRVYTIGYVAEMLGEEEDRLWDVANGMDPEDGHLWVYGVGEDGVAAFTDFGIENLQPARRRSTRRRKSATAQNKAHLTRGSHRTVTMHTPRNA